MRGWRLLLGISLVLNLFLLGVLVGGAAWLRGRTPMIAAGALRIAGAELPEAERVAFRQALRETRRAMRPTVREGRAARDDAAALLRQPAIDQRALLDALARARAADVAVRAAVEARAVAFAATLPPVDRARLADAVARRGRGGARR